MKKSILIIFLALVMIIASCGVNIEIPGNTSVNSSEGTKSIDSGNSQRPESSDGSETNNLSEEESVEQSQPPEESSKPEESDIELPSDIDPDKPMIALTFDDGPGVSTSKILDLLKENNSRATFFLVGQSIKNGKSNVKRASDEGHQILSHTWSHPNLNILSESEIRKELQDTIDAIYEITGKKPSMLRPPYGNANDKVKKVAKEMGIFMVNWSIDTEDWKNKDPDIIFDKIMSKVKDGSIILCHDIHATTGTAMEKVIPELVSRGYQLVTMEELLKYRDIPIEAGTVYWGKY